MAETKTKKWWWSLIPIILTSGVLTTIATYLIENKSQNNVTCQQLLNQVNKINESLTIEMRELKIAHDKIKEDYSELQIKIILLENSHNDLPSPAWLKDLTGKMLWLNDSYEKAFLLPKKLKKTDYIGKYDHDVWQKHEADAFVQNDRQVIRTGQPLITIEAIERQGEKVNLLVMKYLRLIGKNPIGVSGVSIEIPKTNQSAFFKSQQKNWLQQQADYLIETDKYIDKEAIASSVTNYLSKK